MVAGMLYANVLSPATKKFVSAKPPTLIVVEPGQQPVLTAARDDFELERAAVEELFKIEEKQRPVKMDPGSFYAKNEDGDVESYSHEEWVAWTYGEQELQQQGQRQG